MAAALMQKFRRPWLPQMMVSQIERRLGGLGILPSSSAFCESIVSESGKEMQMLRLLLKRAVHSFFLITAVVSVVFLTTFVIGDPVRCFTSGGDA